MQDIWNWSVSVKVHFNCYSSCARKIIQNNRDKHSAFLAHLPHIMTISIMRGQSGICWNNKNVETENSLEAKRS